MGVAQARSTDPIAMRRDKRETAHAFVADVTRSLDFYRELGWEVRLVADGWVQLWRDGTVLVLQQAASLVPTTTVSLVRLTSDDAVVSAASEPVARHALR